jgi:hypothetical protein
MTGVVLVGPQGSQSPNVNCGKVSESRRHSNYSNVATLYSAMGSCDCNRGYIRERVFPFLVAVYLQLSHVIHWDTPGTGTTLKHMLSYSSNHFINMAAELGVILKISDATNAADRYRLESHHTAVGFQAEPVTCQTGTPHSDSALRRRQ